MFLSQLIGLEQLVAQMPGHVYWLDRNNIYQGCNDLQAKSFKLASRHEIVGKTNKDLQPTAELAEICDQNNLEVMRLKTTKILEEPIMLEDGTLGMVLSHKTPILDSNAEVIGILGLSTDVTKKFQYQQQLQQERDQAIITLENIITNLPGHVYWLDRNNIYLGCNDRQAKTFGLRSPTEVVGKTNFDFIKDKKEAEMVNSTNINVMETNTPLLVEEEVILQGKEKIYLSQKAAVKNHDNQIVGIVGISFDITDRKKMECDLIEAKKLAEVANNAKTEFLQNIRHDIRTPVVGIIGCAELIKNARNLTKTKEYSEILIKSSKALLNFLNDILDSVEATSGNIPLLKKSFNLESILLEVIKVNQAIAYDKKLDLKLEYDRSIPSCLIGDPGRLYRIVFELVINALKYTPQGSITIIAQLTKNNEDNVIIKILVKDTGIGIPSHKQDDIFTQFVRLTPSFQGKYGGSGLGLTVIKRFLDDLGGEINVESEVERGSTFSCIIPFKKPLLPEDVGVDLNILNIEEHDATLVTVSEPSENFLTIKTTSSPFRRVLVVEDHDITARVTKEFTSDLGCQTDIAMTGEIAVTLAEKNDYNLIFMDIGLPDSNGYEVTKKIRLSKKNKSIPIIGLTAHINSEDKKYYLDAGMNAIYIKPLIKEKIEDIFNIFMPKYPSQKDNESVTKSINNDNLFSLTGDVIDLKLGIQLANGSESLATEFLNMLVNSFPEELAKLNTAYKAKDLETIKSIIHKLRGALSYCGAPRLREACAKFDNYLASGKDEKITEQLYQQFLLEFSSLQEQMENLKL